MEYNKTVSNIREKARDILRLELVNETKTKILQQENYLKGLIDVKNDTQFLIKCVQYDLSKVDEQNPRADKLKKEYEKNIETYTKETEMLDEKIDKYNKEIDRYKDEINKIQNGETKVSLESLNYLSEKMIYNLDIASGVVVE